MTPERLRGEGEAEGVGGQVRPSYLLCSSLECSPLLQGAGQSPPEGATQLGGQSHAR